MIVYIIAYKYKITFWLSYRHRKHSESTTANSNATQSVDDTHTERRADTSNYLSLHEDFGENHDYLKIEGKAETLKEASKQTQNYVNIKKPIHTNVEKSESYSHYMAMGGNVNIDYTHVYKNEPDTEVDYNNSKYENAYAIKATHEENSCEYLHAV